MSSCLNAIKSSVSALIFRAELEFWGPSVDWDDYLRDEAQKYRKLAEQAEDPLIKQELPELADVCEWVANNIEDHMTAG